MYYLVTFDGVVNDEHKSEIYVLGIYDYKEYAEDAIKEDEYKYKDNEVKPRYRITEIELDKTYESEYLFVFDNYGNNKFLGGVPNTEFKNLIP